MPYTNKHGQKLDFNRHYDINESVLQRYDQFMIQPTIYNIDPSTPELIRQEAVFTFANNGYNIEVVKKSEVIFSNKSTPQYAKTHSYEYMGIHPGTGHYIRYDSAHLEQYSSTLPWEHKHHRHESLNPHKNTEKIEVFANDDRLKKDRKTNLYKTSTHQVTLSYLGEVDWPHVSEFLDEILKLP